MMSRSIPSRFAVASLLVILLQSGSASAQSAPDAPVALTPADAPTLSGFPADAVTDVLGVRIGMTYDDVSQAMLAADYPMLADAEVLPNEDPEAEMRINPTRIGFVFEDHALVPGFTWEDGFKVTFEPVRATAGMTLYHEREDFDKNLSLSGSNSEFFWVAFGGPSVGGRVQEIHRRQVFETPVDLETMLRSLDEKYGAPSHAKDRGSFGVELAWYFKAEAQVMREDKGGFLLTQRCKPYIPSRIPLYDDQQVGSWLGLPQDPRASKEMCEAGIFVRLRPGNVPNTVVGLEVTVMDFLARWENLTAIHAQAEALHDEWLKVSAGSTVAPKL